MLQKECVSFRGYYLLTLWVILSIILCGCGKKPIAQENGVEGSVTQEQLPEGEPCMYRFEITAVPNPNHHLATLLPEGGYISDNIGNEAGDTLFSFQNGVFYRGCRIMQCIRENDKIPVISTVGTYFQYLEAPYEEWVDLVIPEGEGYFQVEDMQVTGDGRMLYLTGTWKGEDWVYSVMELKKDGSAQALSEDLSQEEMQEAWKKGAKEKVELDNKVYQTAKSSDVAACKDKDGKLYFATGQKLWAYTDQEPEEILDFMKQDINIRRMVAMEVMEDGFTFVGSSIDKYYLVRAYLMDEPQYNTKTEIVLASPWTREILRDAIAAFNMQSTQYRVVMDSPGAAPSQSTMDQFKDETQKEMLQGGGPDILFQYMMDSASGYANNGYLLPLDDYFAGREELFWQGDLDGGVINDHRYGIPYSMMLEYLVGDGDKLPAQDTWNARELMSYVRESGARYVSGDAWGVNSWEGVLPYLMEDTKDPTYIDWEKGVSHLNEAPFREVLEFVKEYTPTEEISGEEAIELLQSGECAMYKGSFQSMTNLLFQTALFQGKQKTIGYPSVSGNGIAVYTQNLYVNANTEHLEGVYAFLDYLLSDEGQMNCFTTEYPNEVPIRKETYRWMLDTNGEGTARDNATRTYMGISFQQRKLSEEEKQQAIYLAEHLEPRPQEVYEVRTIISEEAAGYFEGKRSVEETMEILHNRVQLYLDERK